MIADGYRTPARREIECNVEEPRPPADFIAAMLRGRPLVLVVADEGDSRCKFVNWLSAAGYRSIITDDATTALWYVWRLSPPVTVLDVGACPDRARLAAFLASEPAATNVVTHLDPAAFVFAQSTGGATETRCS
jgi:hypothetical protein